MLVQKIRLP